MHSLQTVKYICEHHLASGRKRYYKIEIITDSSWRELDSLRWTKPRPITRRTFRHAVDAGYPCEVKYLRNESAQIVEFPLERRLSRAEFRGPGVVRLMKRLRG